MRSDVAVGAAGMRSVLRSVLPSVLLCCSPYSGRCSVNVVCVAVTVAVLLSGLRCCRVAVSVAILRSVL